jgi:hypothetical protein
MVSSTAEKYLWFLMKVKQPSGHRWKTPLFAVYNDREMNPRSMVIANNYNR